MAEPIITLSEVIGGPPGQAGYYRPGEKRLPDVLLTADEMIHAFALTGAALDGSGDKLHPNTGLAQLDPDCPICTSLYHKLDAVKEAARG